MKQIYDTLNLKRYHINGIALNNDLHGNSNYKILCPLHPKFFAILSPNLGITTPDEVKEKAIVINIYNETVKTTNKLIEHGADKMLFAKNLNDLLRK